MVECCTASAARQSLKHTGHRYMPACLSNAASALARSSLWVVAGNSVSTAAPSLTRRRLSSDASAAQKGPVTCGGSFRPATNLLRMRPCEQRPSDTEVLGSRAVHIAMPESIEQA